MTLLAAGVAIFVAVHVLPCVPGVRAGVRDPIAASLGEKTYKALFSLVSLAGVVLMVVGWRGADAVPLYAPPESLAPVGEALAFLGVVVFLSSTYRSRIRRTVRHPQFVGTVLWAAGHLLSGGGGGVDGRAVVLFGGVGLWALAMVWLGWERDKPADPVSVPADLLGTALSVLATAGVAWLHALIAGGLLSF